MDAELPRIAVAGHLANKIAALDPAHLPASVRRKCEDLLIDVIGLCVTARREPYVKSAIAGWDDEGGCTAIGHAQPMSAAGAAFVNGTAAHGEDFDDTFEGGPVHAGAVIVAALRLQPRQLVDALGIVGSMASGIIEYLAEGAWTKRLHPGWAAQSGIRAALLGRSGFIGPRTVFEGVHGLFHGFAHVRDGDYASLVGDFGNRWVLETLAFKPYPCGTMIQPYIDCARRLAARGVRAEAIEALVCEVAEATVHRLWEPPAQKQRPVNGYAAKFSAPYCVAAGFVHGAVGLDAFTDAAVRDPAVLGVAAKVRYVIDPQNPYPANYTGHIRAL